MSLNSCAKCGKFFKKRRDILCSDCSEEEGNPYKKVREYVYNNRGATVFEVAAETGVSRNLVLKYFKDGVLSAFDDEDYDVDDTNDVEELKKPRKVKDAFGRRYREET